MKIKKLFCIVLSVLTLLPFASVLSFANEDRIAVVREFLNAPSQYTNNKAYGVDIDSVLDGSVTSLGNFGGYAVFELNEPIYNSDSHAYGVDFILSGNAFNGEPTTQEPGQVWVSQNGTDWYALAGSEHYEDETVWDYSVTYKKTDDQNKCDFSDSLGECGAWTYRAQYPLAENYPTAYVPENNLTLSGILLRKQTTGSMANGIQTSFGYTDALKSTNSSEPKNPYAKNPTVDGTDGQFDISWAVDKNGFGMKIDSIKFIKVQTASFINGGAFGEKSTEISGLFRANESKEKFAKTPAPKSIFVGKNEIKIEDGKSCYTASVDGEFDVSVDADADVYINNSYGNSRHFDKKTDKGIIRIIVMSENCLPAIYYISTGKGDQQAFITLSHKEKEIELGNSEKVSAVTNGESVSWVSSDESIASVDCDGTVTAKKCGETYITATTESGKTAQCKITVTKKEKIVTANVIFTLSGCDECLLKNEISVSSDIAEKYGYKTAKLDHNNIKVEGVTVLDAIVAAHEKIYGDSFRKNPESYLIVDNSFILKAFGEKARSSGFTVNGVMPNDGKINPSYGTCTGYACDTARLNDGDDVSYFFYRDLKSFTDVFSLFDSESYEAKADEKFTVNVSGYCAMYYGINEWQTLLEKYVHPLEGVCVYAYIGGDKIYLGRTDKNGNVEITFAEEGEYIIFTQGECSDKAPVITNCSAVKISGREAPHKMTFIEWIRHAWNVIKIRFKSVLDFLFGWIKNKGKSYEKN